MMMIFCVLIMMMIFWENPKGESELLKRSPFSLCVTRWRFIYPNKDFMKALGEIQPKFGADNQELESLYINGIVPHGKEFDNVRDTLERLVEQTRHSERTPIMSVRYISI